MLDMLLTQDVTLVRTTATTIDDEGNARATRRSATYRGLVQQRASHEIQVGPDTVISEHLLILEPDADPSGFDQVVAAGRTFEIIGTPNPMPTLPMQGDGIDHYELDLRAVD